MLFTTFSPWEFLAIGVAIAIVVIDGNMRGWAAAQTPAGLLLIYIMFFSPWGAFYKSWLISMDEWGTDINGEYHWFRGTGAFVNSGDVITNEHVVDRCKSVAVRTQEGVFPGEVIATDAAKDLAIIRTNANQKVFAVLSAGREQEGALAAYPDYTSEPGVFYKKYAKVRARETFKEEVLTYSKIGGTRKGNSGSPVYNKKGYLIGVHHSHSMGNWFILPNHSDFTVDGYGASIDSVVNFLHQHQVLVKESESQKHNLFEEMPGYRDNFAIGVLCNK